MIVECPRCGRKVPYENNPCRPFCSESCRLADLHHWLVERAAEDEADEAAAAADGIDSELES
jgi:endogenous inhibitor of DNA gyrase (YacG/DUF329 family)